MNWISFRSAFISLGDAFMISRPARDTSPDITGSNRAMSLAVVDLPEPLSPTRPMVSPSPTSNETPSTAFTVRGPYRRRRAAPPLTSKYLTSSRTLSRGRVLHLPC